jgi:hypothetical protein
MEITLNSNLLVKIANTNSISSVAGSFPKIVMSERIRSVHLSSLRLQKESYFYVATHYYSIVLTSTINIHFNLQIWAKHITPQQ